MNKSLNFKNSFLFNEIYFWIEKNLSDECIEYIVSMMMEPYPNIVENLIQNMSSDEDKYFNIPVNRTIEELRNILEANYSEILKLGFKK